MQKKQVSAYKSWQINMTDGAENVRYDCALQRLRSAFHPFFKSINDESCVAQMAFSFYSNKIINFNEYTRKLNAIKCMSRLLD